MTLINNKIMIRKQNKTDDKEIVQVLNLKILQERNQLVLYTKVT